MEYSRAAVEQRFDRAQHVLRGLGRRRPVVRRYEFVRLDAFVPRYKRFGGAAERHEIGLAASHRRAHELGVPHGVRVVVGVVLCRQPLLDFCEGPCVLRISYVQRDRVGGEAAGERYMRDGAIFSGFGAVQAAVREEEDVLGAARVQFEQLVQIRARALAVEPDLSESSKHIFRQDAHRII